MPKPRVPEALTRGPFTPAKAAGFGVSKTALESAPWRPVLRGVWVHRDVEDSRAMRLAAARLVLPPSATACGLTAAWLHGVDVRRQDDLDVHAGFPKGARIRHRAGLVVCQETLDANDVTTIDGLRVTTPVRTAFDCLRWLWPVEAVVVTDALAHHGLVTIDEVRGYIAGKRRLRNLRIAEARLSYADPLAESAMETRMRVSLTMSGLPAPVSQHNVYDADGRFVARLDLAYVAEKIAIEYDGALHFEQRRHDDRRRDRLRELGWLVIVISASDYYTGRQQFVATVADQLRRRAPRSASLKG